MVVVKMVQQVGALVALLEEPGYSPSTHKVATLSPVPWDTAPSCGLQGHNTHTGCLNM